MDAEGFPVLPACRAPMQMVMSGGQTTARHAEETMEQFAVDVGNEIGHPVTDATGLKGKYDFTLHWIGRACARSTIPAPICSHRRYKSSSDSSKLEAKKGMADILIVDHLEKTSTEN